MARNGDIRNDEIVSSRGARLLLNLKLTDSQVPLVGPRPREQRSRFEFSGMSSSLHRIKIFLTNIGNIEFCQEKGWDVRRVQIIG